MRGTGPVTVGGVVVYGYFQGDGRATQLRLSADECDRLDLYPGRQVLVGLPGRDPACVLLTAVVPDPPFAWVELERPAAGRAG